MWGLHLKRRGKWWHYYRAVPKKHRDVEARSQICFSLQTTDLSEAKLLAAQISYDFEREWKRLHEVGVSIKGQNACHRYAAAAEIQLGHGLKPQNAADLTDDDLLERLRILISSNDPKMTQRSVLGLIENPTLSMIDGYERFWAHIEDEWGGLSHDQRRVKRNGYLKALSNFREAVGDVPLYEVERHHALTFRSWWLKRLKSKGLKPHTGNKDINAIRRLITTNYDIDAIEGTNPFARIRLKDEPQTPRAPLCRDQILASLQPGALGKMPTEFGRLYRLLINTGMRPVEAIGLELDDIILHHDVPHLHVRKNSIRGLKTAHSERLLPLLGVSLCAAQELVDEGGWGERSGKNMYATSVINKHLRSNVGILCVRHGVLR